jgi:hypothetical protein
VEAGEPESTLEGEEPPDEPDDEPLAEDPGGEPPFDPGLPGVELHAAAATSANTTRREAKEARRLIEEGFITVRIPRQHSARQGE